MIAIPSIKIRLNQKKVIFKGIKNRKDYFFGEFCRFLKNFQISLSIKTIPIVPIFTNILYSIDELLENLTSKTAPIRMFAITNAKNIINSNFPIFSIFSLDDYAFKGVI